MMMKKTLSACCLLLGTLMFFSCGEKRQKSVDELRQEIILEPQMSLDRSDTTEVRALVEAYLENLRGERFDEAAGMIYLLNQKDSIVTLSDKASKKQRDILARYRGVKYDIDQMQFFKETDCLVKYTVTLFENEKGKNYPNKMTFALKPVRRDGKWYLTVADRANTDKSPIERFKPSKSIKK